MVRVIDQQTFDDVVKENMDEFEMTLEEAIEEAVQQFEAQGVNLSGIVKSAVMSGGQDPMTLCVTQLRDLCRLRSASALSLTDHLTQLRQLCAKDLAHKVMAGKQGAFPLLLDILDRFSNDSSTVLLTLETLIALMDGFPDLLDARGVKTIVSFLNTSKNTEVLQTTLKWAKLCCVNHENNRQMLVEGGIVGCLKTVLSAETDGVGEACALVRALTLDDDVRAEVSKAHAHASSLAIELLCPVTSLLAKHKSNKKIINELLMTMNCLIVRNEFCAKVEENGGIPFAIDILTEYPDDEKIVRNALLLLKGLAGNDDVKLKIMQAGAPSLVLLALSRHQKSPLVCNAGLSCITILSLRSQDNSKTFVDEGAPEIIVQIMKVHPKDFKIQRNCCWAIRNIVSRAPTLKDAFLKRGAEDLINAARRQHKEIDYDAKSSLRDLGCHVDFNEQWKGQGKNIGRN